MSYTPNSHHRPLRASTPNPSVHFSSQPVSPVLNTRHSPLPPQESSVQQAHRTLRQLDHKVDCLQQKVDFLTYHVQQTGILLSNLKDHAKIANQTISLSQETILNSLHQIRDSIAEIKQDGK